MKEKIALGVFIFSILALLIVVFFVAFQNKNAITGKVIGSVKEEILEEEGEFEVSCSDSDNGKDYFVKGVVSYCSEEGCSSEEDSCYGKKLVEWYCENNEKGFERYECEDECDDGVCASLVTEYRRLGGGGGGSSSSGGTSSAPSSPPAPASTGETYDLGELSERHLEVVENDNIRFTFSGIGYTITLSESTGTQVEMDIDNGQVLTISVGEEREVDLNNDGVSDVYLWLRSINSVTKKINLILRNL